MRMVTEKTVAVTSARAAANVRVTPAQAQHFRGAFTACSRVCVLKARDIRTQQWRLGLGVPGPSEGAARTRALGPEEGAVQEQ